MGDEKKSLYTNPAAGLIRLNYGSADFISNRLKKKKSATRIIERKGNRVCILTDRMLIVLPYKTYLSSFVYSDPGDFFPVLYDPGAWDISKNTIFLKSEKLNAEVDLLNQKVFSPASSTETKKIKRGNRCVCVDEYSILSARGSLTVSHDDMFLADTLIYYGKPKKYLCDAKSPLRVTYDGVLNDEVVTYVYEYR